MKELEYGEVKLFKFLLEKYVCNASSEFMKEQSYFSFFIEELQDYNIISIKSSSKQSSVTVQPASIMIKQIDSNLFSQFSFDQKKEIFSTILELLLKGDIQLKQEVKLVIKNLPITPNVVQEILQYFSESLTGNQKV